MWAEKDFRPEFLLYFVICSLKVNKQNFKRECALTCARHCTRSWGLSEKQNRHWSFACTGGLRGKEGMLGKMKVLFFISLNEISLNLTYNHI